MDLILLEKVRNLGMLGDKVTVKPGYGRNFLLPQGRAVRVTAENLAKFEARRAELEKIAKDALDNAHVRAQKLAEQVISVAARASDEGKLFGSVGAKDIASAVAGLGVELEAKEVLLPDGPLRDVGEYTIELQLHSDVVQAIKVLVEAQEQV